MHPCRASGACRPCSVGRACVRLHSASQRWNASSAFACVSGDGSAHPSARCGRSSHGSHNTFLRSPWRPCCAGPCGLQQQVAADSASTETRPGVVPGWGRLTLLRSRFDHDHDDVAELDELDGAQRLGEHVAEVRVGVDPVDADRAHLGELTHVQVAALNMFC